MNATRSASVPGYFWIVSGLALVWNLMGVAAYVAQVTMSETAIAGLPEVERLLLETTPAWATGAFAIGVFAGALGCIALLIKKKVALPLFVISLLGILVQQVNGYFVSNAIEVYGAQAIVLPVLVLAIAVALLWFTTRATAQQLLT